MRNRSELTDRIGGVKVVDEARSRIMRAVKSKDTNSEIAVRKLVHAMGFRFRLHRKDLPGSPDLVFPSRRKVIFVHGCFWHGHGCKRGARLPKTNVDYWTKKISNNCVRDSKAIQSLKEDGWDVCVVWECELRDSEQLQARLSSFLTSVTPLSDAHVRHK
ncbi:MAG: very short patch repair endonuclease [Castellaniella sp.]|nr:very short patch repair endonuclease [Castellaniella sp.]